MCDNFVTITFLFIYYIQQFITQSMVADHGSYFVTTYNRSKLHVEEEKGKKEKKKIEEKT